MAEASGTLAGMIEEVADKTNWKMRRRYLIAVTAFCMVAIAGAMFGPVQATIGEAVVAWGFMLLASNTAVYVFGAAWDHANIRSTIAQFGRSSSPTSQTTGS